MCLRGVFSFRAAAIQPPAALTIARMQAGTNSPPQRDGRVEVGQAGQQFAPMPAPTAGALSALQHPAACGQKPQV